MDKRKSATVGKTKCVYINGTFIYKFTLSDVFETGIMNATHPVAIAPCPQRTKRYTLAMQCPG